MNEMILVGLCFFSGIAGALALIRFGERIGMTDIPGQRSSHTQKICKGGGVGILFAMLIAASVLNIPHFLWVPALIISLASLWGGDYHKLTVKQRLAVQFGCSAYFLLCLFLSGTLNTGDVLSWRTVPPGALLAIFIAGTSNFYNFMDGIDGIAGITGVIGFLLLAVYGSRIHAAPDYITFSLCISAGCLGFLLFNFPKARIFSGDVGSILIGFLFACLTLVLAGSAIDFIVMAGFIFPFYMDELTTMALRIRDREPLIVPHRRHLYQVLANEMQTPHWRVSVAYGVFQTVAGVSLMAAKPLGAPALFLTCAVHAAVFMTTSLLVRTRACAAKRLPYKSGDGS